jgi:hypothetical protein
VAGAPFQTLLSVASFSGVSLAHTVQVKPLSGTEPLLVDGLNVQFTVITSSPASNMPFPLESWNTWIMADVNAISVMFSVHPALGQLGAPAIGVTGGFVSVLMVTFPFTYVYVSRGGPEGPPLIAFSSVSPSG